jgi:hypothetical protein
MNVDELKTAFATEKPVVWQGSIYKCISAIIWRKDKEGRRILRAELLDMNKNSVVVVDPYWVHYHNEDEIINKALYTGKD